jgi:hypothetical protein
LSRTRQSCLSCPSCNVSFDAKLYSSINADRHPELRQAILDNSFHRHPCSCGTNIQLAVEDLNYLDIGRKQWLAIHERSKLGYWRKYEEKTQALFDMALGKDAPKSAREIGAGLSPQLVFGLNALREKLLIHDYGFDDVTMECVKLTIMKEESIAPAAEQELRLTGRKDGALLIELLNTDNQKVVTAFGVPENLYKEIAANQAWVEIAKNLASGPFVDMQKMWYGD